MKKYTHPFHTPPIQILIFKKPPMLKSREGRTGPPELRIFLLQPPYLSSALLREQYAHFDSNLMIQSKHPSTFVFPLLLVAPIVVDL